MEAHRKNQIIFFTGATSGIGKVAALKLAADGATVVVTVRDEKKGEELMADFDREDSGNKGKIEIIPCNLASFSSVKKAVDTFKESHSRIDILINNAGVFNPKFETTVDNIEKTFQVNALSPLLFSLLFEEMIIGNKGRIINTTSSLHHGTIHFNDIEGRNNYSGLNAYRQSKLSILLWSKIMAEHLNGSGSQIVCLHPGIVRTNLGNETPNFFNFGLKLIGTTAEKGASLLIQLTTAPSDQLLSGGYYANKKLWTSKPLSNNTQLANHFFQVALSYLEPYLKS